MILLVKLVSNVDKANDRGNVASFIVVFVQPFPSVNSGKEKNVANFALLANGASLLDIRYKTFKHNN